MHEYQRRRLEAGQRFARRRPCPKCGTPVLEGYDADDVALLVRVDVEPVTAIVEAAALLSGFRSCNLIRQALWARYDHHTGLMQYSSGPARHGEVRPGSAGQGEVGITKKQEPENEHPIHIEHRCEKETLW